ncbi:MAG TPA: NADH-quinone oxidoreductase subunit H [Ktedonobacterales bacterium]
MSGALEFALAALVYPGAVVALLGAWALGWARDAAREMARGARPPRLFTTVAAIRGMFSRETLVPAGVNPLALSLGVTLALAAPFAALVALPLPGNPLTQAVGLRGDLIAEAGLLLGLPLGRLLIGWATPSPYTRLAADRNARLFAGAVAPLILGLTAVAQIRGTLTIWDASARAGESGFTTLTLVVAGAAFLIALPALAAGSPMRLGAGSSEALAGEATELSGQDLALFLIGEALQLVACAAFFTLVFVAPLVAGFQPAWARWVIEIVAALVVAAGLGYWEGRHGRPAVAADRPPLSWWAGVPVLVSLVALVLAAWATRG